MKWLAPFIFLAPMVALAHQPWLIEFAKYEDTYEIESPHISHAFYTTLTGFPHNYEFTVSEKQEVFVEILVPDVDGIENNRSGLLVKRAQKGIELISRLDSPEATWESFYEGHGGDYYRRGPSYRGELEPGRYLLEVSTADNFGKYVLVVGEREDFSNLGKLELYKRIYLIKRFFGKSPVAVFESPYYYIPAGLIILSVAVFYWRKRKQRV